MSLREGGTRLRGRSGSFGGDAEISASTTRLGEEGTGGNESGGGRALPFPFAGGREPKPKEVFVGGTEGGRAKDVFVGGAEGGILNELLVGGADGGGRCIAASIPCNRRCRAAKLGLAVEGVGAGSVISCTLSRFASGDVLGSSSVVSPLWLRDEMLGASKPPPTPSSSSFSSSSTKSSENALPVVRLLCKEPVRFREA